MAHRFNHQLHLYPRPPPHRVSEFRWSFVGHLHEPGRSASLILRCIVQSVVYVEAFTIESRREILKVRNV